MAAPRWAAGWYVTKRHIMAVRRPYGGTASSLCRRASVYPEGGGYGDYAVPPADSAEVMALPACKYCERLAAR